MNRSPVILFMDSGLGGVPYLQWVRSKRPHWQYVYLADHSHFPYGIRSSAEIQDRLISLSQSINRLYSPDMAVIACNTASVTALECLRSHFSLPFVGVVPAVKPAALIHGEGTIGVLATEKTVKGEYLRSLIRQFAPQQAVETKAAGDLVNFVENRLFLADEDEIRSILSPYLDLIKRKNWNTVVLGCTHFILLKPWLRKWLPSFVSIIDSTEGVGRRILSLLPESDFSGGENISRGDQVSGKEESGGVFHITGNKFNRDIYSLVAKMNGLKFAALEENAS